MHPKSLAVGIGIGAVIFTGVSVVFAWTGPSSAPPNGNASAPVNVSSIDQVKNGGLGINSLAVFGNAILSGASHYLNFGSTAGSVGYGFRDNAGTMEFKSSGGAWTAMSGASSSPSMTDAYFSSRGLWASQLGRLGEQFWVNSTVTGSGWLQSANFICPSGSVSVGMSFAVGTNISTGVTSYTPNRILCQWINQ
jgi:hypothetical protein